MQNSLQAAGGRDLRGSGKATGSHPTGHAIGKAYLDTAASSDALCAEEPAVTVVVEDWQLGAQDQGGQLPIAKKVLGPQQRQQVAPCANIEPRTADCSLLALAAAGMYSAPQCWGRPDDTKKTLPEQWRLHMSPWRFLNALVPYLGPPTFTLMRIWTPFLAVVLQCAVLNLLAVRIAWRLDQYHVALTCYRTSQFMLALLLAFRLNRTYDRWWQARCAFGGIGGGLINIVRQVATYSNDTVLIRNHQKWSMCMIYGMVQLINNTPKVTDPRVAQLLQPEELALYSSTTKPAKLCGSMLSALLASAGFDIEKEVYLNQMLGQVAASVSLVARIKLQAMPFGMSLFCSGWTFIWLLLLPFGIVPDTAAGAAGATWWAMLPISVMTIMMLGLEDLACQLEDPFKFIPYEAMVATTAKDMPRTVAEVQACKRMVLDSCKALQGEQCQSFPAWPELKPVPQSAG